jgi:predicted dehydrogenase
LLLPAARPYADLPGGHSEGYDDTFKQMFRRFYRAVEDASVPIEYPQFVDGLRQLQILDAELSSSAARAWVDVPAA